MRFPSRIETAMAIGLSSVAIGCGEKGQQGNPEDRDSYSQVVRLAEKYCNDPRPDYEADLLAEVAGALEEAIYAYEQDRFYSLTEAQKNHRVDPSEMLILEDYIPARGAHHDAICIDPYRPFRSSTWRNPF